MVELTNEQRPCFGIQPVDPAWRRVQLIRSRYHDFDAFAYLEGDHIRHLIMTGENMYKEHALNETVSPDGMYLFPKTDKGKPVKLSAAALMKRTPVGMVFWLEKRYTCRMLLYSAQSDQGYFDADLDIATDMQAWVDQWCADTTEADLADVAAFANCPRLHVKFREGDYFRFRIGRWEYGYGRLLINYSEMRRKNLPFWDQFMGKPLLVGCYRIITSDPNVTPDELDQTAMLPPCMMMDNKLLYGSYEIIGHGAVDLADFDCPIHYGRGYSRDTHHSVFYQCGRVYRELPNTEPLETEFRLGASASRSNRCRTSCVPAWKPTPTIPTGSSPSTRTTETCVIRSMRTFAAGSGSRWACDGPSALSRADAVPSGLENFF